MKNIAVLILMIALVGCEKTANSIKEDLVIKAMTDGQWKITSFTINGASVTADYASYRFKYFSNNTVDAIKNAVVEKTGTWNGDAPTMTISAQFPSVTYPLDQINGSWQITRNSWTFVESTQNSSAGVKTMRLDKE